MEFKTTIWNERSKKNQVVRIANIKQKIKMATINEILDSENVKSNLESWKNECLNFRSWYVRTGAEIKSEEAMATAYIKIEAKTTNINNLYNLLS